MLTHTIDPHGFCTLCGADIDHLNEIQDEAFAAVPHTIIRFENDIVRYGQSLFEVPASSQLIQAPIVERLREAHTYTTEEAERIAFHLHWILLRKGFRADMRHINEIDPTASVTWLPVAS